jgi:hypothetical protein
LGGRLRPEDFITIEALRLSPEEFMAGHFRHELTWNNREEARAQAGWFITSTLAGRVAELRINHRAERSPSDDALAAEAFQRFVHAGVFAAYLRLKTAEAEALVESYWSAIQEFASELLDRETINGTDCEKLFHRICGPAPTAQQEGAA